MHVVGMSVENFKRILIAEVRFDDDGPVEVSGKNGQGKSSLLDALEAALGGKKRAPKEPIRRGAEKARVVVDLGDFIVERVFTAKTDRLVLKAKDGASYPAAQGRLDKLVGGLAFDPMEFMGLKPQEQRETLLRLAGVDLEDLDRERAIAFEGRRDAGRDLRAAEARLAAEPEPAKDVPAEEVGVAELTAELEAALFANRGNDEQRRDADDDEEAAIGSDAVAAQAAQTVARLKEQLLHAEKAAAEAAKEAEEAKVFAAKSRKAADALENIETEPIRQRIAAAEGLNQQVRQAAKRRALAAEVAKLAKLHEKHDKTIASVDERKARALADAKMPVDGLGLGDDGVTFGGIALDQASESERIRVCTAIAARLNPELRIALVRNGNDLDSDTLRAFYEACQATGLQPWVERIVPSREDAIVIEEGEIAGGDDKAPAKK